MMQLPANRSVKNRSIPASTVIPVLCYEDVGQAVDWLCNAFGFRERLRIGTHRAQLLIGDGAVVVRELYTSTDSDSPDSASSQSPRATEINHSVLVRVEDVDRHYERALKQGARILHPPTDYPYGERQYSAEDPGGHQWTFSQSIADVAPEEWGGTVVRLESETPSPVSSSEP